MSLFGNYDFGSYQGSSGSDFDLIPNGSALANITGRREVKNADGSWKGVSIEFTIQEGDFARRKVWQTFTLHYPQNTEVQDDGRNKLVGLLKAAGHPGPQSNEPIEGRPVCIKIIQKKRKNSDEKENAVAAWMPAADYANRPDKLTKKKPGRYVDAAMTAAFGGTMAMAPTPAASKPDLNDDIPF
ncbi:MAG: hypothetical protein AB7P02_12950 [Alphaproteobacteria bacterium]